MGAATRRCPSSSLATARPRAACSTRAGPQATSVGTRSTRSFWPPPRTHVAPHKASGRQRRGGATAARDRRGSTNRIHGSAPLLPAVPALVPELRDDPDVPADGKHVRREKSSCANAKRGAASKEGGSVDARGLSFTSGDRSASSSTRARVGWSLHGHFPHERWYTPGTCFRTEISAGRSSPCSI